MTKLVVFMDHKLCTFASEKIVYYRTTTTTTTWNQGKEKRAQFLFCLHLCSAQQGAVKSRDITRASVLKRKYGVVQELGIIFSIAVSYFRLTKLERNSQSVFRIHISFQCFLPVLNDREILVFGSAADIYMSLFCLSVIYYSP